MKEFEVCYYVCEHCGKKFDDRDECIEHEKNTSKHLKMHQIINWQVRWKVLHRERRDTVSEKRFSAFRWKHSRTH